MEVVSRESDPPMMKKVLKAALNGAQPCQRNADSIIIYCAPSPARFSIDEARSGTQQ